MALIFEEQDKASFKVTTLEDGADVTINGVNSTVASAQTICDGVASLLACASLTGIYDGAIRTVKQDVNDE